MAYIFTTDTVDPEFAGRALEADWLRGEPLLRDARPDDCCVVVAEGTGPYELIDPDIDIDELVARILEDAGHEVAVVVGPTGADVIPYVT